MELAMAPASMTSGSKPRRRAEMAQASPIGPAPTTSTRSVIGAPPPLELPPEREQEGGLAPFLQRPGEPHRQGVAEETDPEIHRLAQLVADHRRGKGESAVRIRNELAGLVIEFVAEGADRGIACRVAGIGPAGLKA